MSHVETIESLTTQELLRVGQVLLQLGYEIKPDASVPTEGRKDLIGPTRLVSEHSVVVLHKPNETIPGRVSISGPNATILRQWLERGVLCEAVQEAPTRRGAMVRSRPAQTRATRKVQAPV